MAAQIIKTYKQRIPTTKFIGKLYGNEDRVDGMFGAKWGEWHANGWFDAIEKSPGRRVDYYEDGDAYIGLMRYKEGDPPENFQYWIGIFCNPETEVPDGYVALDFPEFEVGVCWIKGQEWECYMQDEATMIAFEQNGIAVSPRSDGAWWFFERYQCPRFTTPDENGEVILDYAYFEN